MGGTNAVDVDGGDVQGLRHMPSLRFLDRDVDVGARAAGGVLG
jgi:hypothetical protein